MSAVAPENVAGEFVAKVPISFARRHGVLGLIAKDGRMPMLMASEAALPAAQNVARMLGMPIEPVMAPAEEIAAAIAAAYSARTGQAAAIVETLDRKQVLSEVSRFASGGGGREDLLDTAGRAPTIRLVNLLLLEAVQARASDIHVQPYENSLAVRLRIDGVLYDLFELPKAIQDEVVSRVKVMGRMDIAERRLAQDGRATADLGDRAVDLRLATLPTSFGERVVIRLLDQNARPHSLGEIGMDPATLENFRNLISLDHGIILVTGPTGSGKTTTLYSALTELNAKELNILTLEDPIEYRLERISQTQVSDKKGMTFASGLRSVLRQDPDIIMVGEIRDHDTATMAIQAALTGHLVFSTLHTNDAAGAVTRLLDLGIEPYLLASSLVGVLAQRLVRTVCPQCAQVYTPTAQELSRLGVRGGGRELRGEFKMGAGCAHCRNTGYRGRLGVFEMLTLTNEIRSQIQGRASSTELKDTAVAAGMKTLRDDALAKAGAGRTTIGEVLRVTTRTEI